MLGHSGLIAAGLLLITLGFWGGTRLRSPYGDLVALGAPAGLLVTLAGVLLLIIPRFFA
jgi:hypothetical protein